MTSRHAGYREWLAWQFEPPMRFINGLLASLAFIAIAWSVWVPGQEGMLQNLIAEVFGVWLAVVIVGAVLREYQQRREFPAREAALRRVHILYGKLTLFWLALARHGIRSAEIEEDGLSLHEFNPSDPRLEQLVNNINLRGNAPSFLQEPMHVYLNRRAYEIQRRIETICQGYVMYLPPEILRLLGQIEENPLIMTSAGDLEHTISNAMAIVNHFKKEAEPDRPYLVSAVLGQTWHEDFLRNLKQLEEQLEQHAAEAGISFEDRTLPETPRQKKMARLSQLLRKRRDCGQDKGTANG